MDLESVCTLWNSEYIDTPLDYEEAMQRAEEDVA